MDETAAKRVFDYGAFIAELTPLVEQAKELDAKDRHEASDAFREWRHKTHDLITRIGRQRYEVNCDLEIRAFQVQSYNSISPREQRERFDRDLKDTIIELDHIIALYNKYGDPPAARPATGTPAASESMAAEL